MFNVDLYKHESPPVADFEDVLVTVVFLLRKNPRAEFWTTYQVRRYV